MKKFKLPQIKFKLSDLKLRLPGRKAKAAPALEGEEELAEGPGSSSTALVVHRASEPVLTINLQDYRVELGRIAIQKTVVQTAAIPIVFLMLLVAHWFVEQTRLGQMKLEVAQLEKQVQDLQPAVDAVKQMDDQKARFESIAKGIVSLRDNQLETTRLLNDIYNHIPEQVWLTGITQKDQDELLKEKVPLIFIGDPEQIEKERKEQMKKQRGKKVDNVKDFIEIKGTAMGEQATHSIARLVDDLEQVPYFKVVFLFQTVQRVFAGFGVTDFTIYCYMPREHSVT